MKHNIEFKGFDRNDAAEPKEAIRKLIEDQIARLEKRTKSFSPDVTFLRILVEDISAHKLYHVSVTLDVPGKTLAAKKETHAAEAGVREAFAEIQRQLEDRKATLRGEHE